MPQTKKKDDMARRPGESILDYLKRVKVYMKKIKTTDWAQVEKYATKMVKEIRRDPDEAIRKEIDPGYRYTPKKRKKQIG